VTKILLLFDGAQLTREIILLRSPATAPENMIDAWLMTSPLGTPRGRCDEYSSKIFPQLRNQGMSILERRDKRLKVMRTGLIALQQGHRL
jgi:hypothetical protein